MNLSDPDSSNYSEPSSSLSYEPKKTPKAGPEVDSIALFQRVRIYHDISSGRHSEIDTAEARVKCNYPGCLMEFIRSDNIKEHLRTHFETSNHSRTGSLLTSPATPSSGMPGQPGGPQNQGSPMMTQGQDGGSIANYYNPGDMAPNGIRGGPNQGNHALQDYQMQLMLLEQQDKKRLMMARQEQDNMSIPRPSDGSSGPGMSPNG
jgi:hypothetical protein